MTPVAPGLFTIEPSGPRLVASRCSKCGEVAFPKQASCAACAASAVEEIALSTSGTLWTFTIQRFPPPTPPYVAPPGGFRPYGVGYVELPEGVRVEARLTESDPAKLSIGMRMRLVLEVVASDGAGGEVVTFAFAPA
jgi:uncharacterized OB-fold protein